MSEGLAISNVKFLGVSCDDVEKYKQKLEEEYGAININIEDGTYTVIEKE